MIPSFWTETRHAQLVRLAALGLSAARIAERIGDGCTRNAVIGRAWRTGVTLQGPAVLPDGAAGGRASAHARRINPIHLPNRSAA